MKVYIIVNLNGKGTNAIEATCHSELAAKQLMVEWYKNQLLNKNGNYEIQERRIR
jgi:hypothetical protein